MARTVWSVSRLLFFYSRCPAICKSVEARAPVPCGVGAGERADWASWQPGTVGPASRWAATSTVEVGQPIYLVYRERLGREGRVGSKRQSHRDEERERWSGTGEKPGAISSGGRALLGICAGVPPRVPSYATADEAGLPT